MHKDTQKSRPPKQGRRLDNTLPWDGETLPKGIMFRYVMSHGCVDRKKREKGDTFWKRDT